VDFSIPVSSYSLIFKGFPVKLGILENASSYLLPLTGCLPLRTKLTPSFVLNAVAETGADRTLFWDETLPGFGLMVTKGGHRSYVYQYRAGGRSRRMTFPITLGLDKARREARKAVGGVAGGGDPLGERRKAAAMGENTLQTICEDYLKREGKRLRSRKIIDNSLKRLVYPKLGARQIDGILRSEIVKLLDKIEDKNGPVMADRVLAYVRKVMNWHASRSDDFRSPIVRGMARTKTKERERERVLSDDELRAVWSAAETFAGPFGRYIRFVLLTATRRNEAADMPDTELLGNDWIIPAARYKTKLDHVVPLSRAARDLLASIPRIKGVSYFFTTGSTPIRGFGKFKTAFDEACGVTDWTLHDLRRTARSLMSRAGVDSDHAERCLGHVIGGVRGTYDRHAYYDEKKHAFEALAGQIDRILNPQDNVIPMRSEVPA
jgi:integrase